jgi:excisionase family DNA binding protein
VGLGVIRRMTAHTESTALLKPGEAAAYLRISRRALLDNAAAGIIPVIRVNPRVYRFRRADIEALNEKDSPGHHAERAENHGADTPHGQG